MSLKEVFQPYFYMGAAIPEKAFLVPAVRAAIKEQFNSLTCENELKPERILDKQKNQMEPEKYGNSPALDFTEAKAALDYVKEHGLCMRGHTLVWHNQTPDWFFHEKYDCDAPYADREEMLLRMEGYIRGVLTWVQTNYPGIIYAWDVVNEAILENGLRDSLWTRTVGDDFILWAFRYAKLYADESVLLFYNDYETYQPWKRELICKLVIEPLKAENLIDGMGMQGHLSLQDLNFTEFRTSLETFGKLVKHVHVTELDIHTASNAREQEKRLAKSYQRLFEMFLDVKKQGLANVGSVTFWGLNDGMTWLTYFRKEKSYPLLFDETMKPKLAYWAVVSVPGKFEEDVEDRLPHGQRFEFWETKQKYIKELHVNAKAENASDTNDGSEAAPFASIRAAADIAEPGTRILIHEGVYRECVRPQKGGRDPENMISYEAYQDEKVVIKASEVVGMCKPSQGWDFRGKDVSSMKIWETKINPDQFRGYNPFCAVNILHDRLFIEYEKTDMLTYLNRRGMVFCDGKPLLQVPLYCHLADYPGSYWVEANGMTVHFRLPEDDSPEQHLIELTCREQCFAPDIPFLSYIRVKGITFAHAATGAPVPQRGALSCYRGHHWIIEDCKIDWSNAVGIDVGNECWHHTIEKEQLIGYTVIRGCEIKDAGVCGIAGLFARNLLIEDNLISGTGWQKMELSWEAGGIKVHNSINSLIRRNIFTETLRADHLWMDVGNENNRITGNLFLNGREQREAIFIECSRDDVNLIDNNIFWNIEGRFDPAKVPNEPGSTGWYKMTEHDVVNGYAVYGEGADRLQVINNLIGNVKSAGYYAKPVSFRFGEHGIRGGTSREANISNNIFYNCGEAAIKFPTKENEAQGNIYAGMYTGGYLRVLYPAPENCLNLQAWTEFFGFDVHGLEGRFRIEMDTENYKLCFVEADPLKGYHPMMIKQISVIDRVEDALEVEPYIGIQSDFFGNCIDEYKVPGPFAELKSNVVYHVDPRKKAHKGEK